ncbi:MAG: nucleotidyl transferase AbiEii/AbiGii toxin family protein [Patescibacteria group bacterium]
MESSLLTDEQKTILKCVFEEPRLGDFYLSGGTALAAFHLRHRVSDDLDFFSYTEVDGQFVQNFTEALRRKIAARSVAYDRLYDRRLFTFILTADQILKIEFTHYPFLQLEQPETHDGIRVDGKRDLAANKLMTMLDRFDPKDFVDLYFLLEERPLADMVKDAETKFLKTIDPVFLGGELLKARRIVGLPRMIKPLSVKTVTDFFTEQARSLKKDIFSEG